MAYASNCVSAFSFIAMGLCFNDGTGDGAWWQAAITAGCFVAGQTLASAAFKYGDVSVATPVLGLKLILVALFAVILLGDTGSPEIWTGAILATIGAMLVGKTDGRRRGNVWLTMLLSLGGATGYASFDVCLQKWAPLWGVQHFLLWTFIWVALLSQTFLPLIRKPTKGLMPDWTISGLSIEFAVSFPN